MQHRSPLLAWLVFSALAASVAAAQSASSHRNAGPVAYRWVDDQGGVHYGDQVPPQYATRDRALLNSQGVEVGHVDAQRTREQIAADEHANAEILRQQQHDRFLVATYASVKEIEGLRDARLEQMKGQRAAAEQYLEGLRSRLSTLQSRALSFAPYSERPGARRMPDDLAENLVRTENELRLQGNALAARTLEETQTRAQFQADIERFRQLRSVHADN